MYYIWKEWKENIRGKGLWLALGIVVAVSVAMLVKSSSLSFDQGYFVLLINVFDSFVYFLPVLCLFLGAFSIFQEKEQKTLVMLLTKQENYSSFLLKKSIGINMVLAGPISLWLFIYLLPVKFYFAAGLKEYFLFLAAIIGLIVIFTQIGTFIGSISRSRMQIVGYTIAIWFYFFFLHDFILLSFLPGVSYENVKLFSIVYFLNPIQAARMFLEAGLGIYSFGHMSRLLQSFMWTKPMVFFTGSLMFWLGVSFAGSILFHRKEGSE